jgi:hypothetical protein
MTVAIEFSCVSAGLLNLSKRLNSGTLISEGKMDDGMQCQTCCVNAVGKAIVQEER